MNEWMILIIKSRDEEMSVIFSTTKDLLNRENLHSLISLGDS